MIQRNSPDGTYYFVEVLVPTKRTRVFRALVHDGVAHDEIWNVQSRDWAPTRLLGPYRMSMGENDLYEVSAEQSEQLRTQKQQQYDARTQQGDPGD